MEYRPPVAGTSTSPDREHHACLAVIFAFSCYARIARHAPKFATTIQGEALRHDFEPLTLPRDVLSIGQVIRDIGTVCDSAQRIWTCNWGDCGVKQSPFLLSFVAIRRDTKLREIGSSTRTDFSPGSCQSTRAGVEWLNKIQNILGKTLQKWRLQCSRAAHSIPSKCIDLASKSSQLC